MMSRLLTVTTTMLLFGVVDFGIFLTGYGVLRLLRISVHWVTWIVGGLLVALSGLIAVFIFAPGANQFWSDGLLGFLSFFVAVYAASQWTTRQGYLRFKRRAFPALARQGRTLLIFLRRHHQFFGWLVLITATGHGISYVPVLSRVSSREVITGLLLWGVLVVLTALGLWVDRAAQRKARPHDLRLQHALLSLFFFVGLLLHV